MHLVYKEFRSCILWSWVNYCYRHSPRLALVWGLIYMMISEREKGLAFSSTFTMRKAEECNGVSGAAVPLQVPKKWAWAVFYSSYMAERGSLGDLKIFFFLLVRTLGHWRHEKKGQSLFLSKLMSEMFGSKFCTVSGWNVLDCAFIKDHWADWRFFTFLIKLFLRTKSSFGVQAQNIMDNSWFYS